MYKSEQLESVKNQYDELPYPTRNPEDEKRRLICTVGSNLVQLNHFCFRGQRDFRQGFRCLVAGGGSGDCVVALAEQLRDFDAEIVYLDFSMASRKVAEERARIRGLDNITWVTEDILNIPKLDLGKFDFINCAGVLHHLKSIDAGLSVLAESLKDDGGMYLVLFGKYGRSATHEMQTLLREYLPDEKAHQEKINMTRELLGSLPDTNSFKRDLDRWSSVITSDAGLYFLLLQSQDHCFTVDEVYQLAESSGLHLQGFVGHNSAAYEPLLTVTNEKVRQHLVHRSRRDRQSIGELLSGTIRKHEFFLSKQERATASLDDHGNALLACNSMNFDAPKIAASMPDTGSITYSDRNTKFTLSCNPIARVVFSSMDGSTSLKELYELIKRAVPSVNKHRIEQEIRSIYDRLHPRSYLYLLRAGSQGVKIPNLVDIAGKADLVDTNSS